MKGRIMLITLLSLLFTLNGLTIYDKHETNPIILEGELQSGSIRKGGYDITAFVQNDAITINFHQNFGNLQVTLNNSMSNTVFQINVDTFEQTQAYIPLSYFPSDMYTIIISNSYGSLIGYFEL